MPGEKLPTQDDLEAQADAILAANGLDETGRNPQQDEAERREWQTMGLEKDVNTVSREIAEKAYDNMSGPDSPDPAGREAQIDAVETTVKEAAPKIAEEAYDIMTGEKATTENPSTMGEQKPIIESEELENTGTDNN